MRVIKFNKAHPSHDREVIGGNELQIIEELINAKIE